jgi:hypothetical protein
VSGGRKFGFYASIALGAPMGSSIKWCSGNVLKYMDLLHSLIIRRSMQGGDLSEFLLSLAVQKMKIIAGRVRIAWILSQKFEGISQQSHKSLFYIQYYFQSNNIFTREESCMTDVYDRHFDHYRYQ